MFDPPAQGGENIDPTPALRCKLCQRFSYRKVGKPGWLLIATWGPLIMIDRVRSIICWFRIVSILRPVSNNHMKFRVTCVTTRRAIGSSLRSDSLNSFRRIY